MDLLTLEAGERPSSAAAVTDTDSDYGPHNRQKRQIIEEESSSTGSSSEDEPQPSTSTGKEGGGQEVEGDQLSAPALCYPDCFRANQYHTKFIYWE